MRWRLALSLSALLLLGASSAQAISVGPGIIEMQADAGAITDSSFVVTNEESETLSFALTIQKFIPQGDEGRTQFLPTTDTTGLPDWLFLDSSTITLRPGESKRVPVSLRVPNEATPGGHYAAIFLTQTSLDTAAGQNVSAIPRIGVLVFTTVNGVVNERAVLKDVSVDQSVYASLPVRFRLALENQGNVHVQPKVQVEIKNMFGNTVAKIDGNPEGGRILPGSSRRFVFDWQKDATNTENGFFGGLKQEWSNFGLGFYEADVKASTQKSGEIGESIIRFQVWPWRLALVGLAGLVCLFIALKLVRGLFVKR